MIRPILIIFLLIIIVLIHTLSPREAFTNNQERPNIWMYWENKPGKMKPEYLNLCYETVVKNCEQSFTINLLNEKTVYNFLPNLRRDLDQYMSIPQKTDLIRLSLLHKYGGIWVDSDTIVIRDLKPLWDKTKKHEYIGFGCTGNGCKHRQSGYPSPSNWMMISRKGGKLMRECLKEANRLLETDSGIFKRKYHIIGRLLLWKKIKELRKTGWDYFHVDSRCAERDSNGVKYRNNRLISKECYDESCKDKIYFLPIYNTAPGFPKWFLEKDRDSLLNSEMLISEMYRMALN